MGGSLLVYSVELLLFYVLALGIIFLPLRWSLLCLLLVGNVMVNPSSFVSTSSVSWQNAVETIVLPALLLLRLTRFRLPRIRRGFPARAWTALVLYAAVSTLWSPFKLSGVKMVGYLAAWFIIYLVFDLAWRRGLLDQGIIIAALWGSLALACLQTYVLGNSLYGTEGRVGEFVSAQFAPFRGPQLFGPFLACILTLLLFSREKHRFRALSVGTCLIALVLVGSRYSLIESGIVVLAWCFLRARVVRLRGGLRPARAMVILLLALAVLLVFRTAMVSAMPGSRVNQLLELEAQPQLWQVGDFGWRLLVYGDVLTTLSERSPIELVFGSGTSSGGEVAISDPAIDVEYEDVDPNRTIHDEFLRTEYEWGIIGLGLGLALLVYTVRKLWVGAFRLNSLAGFGALAIMPGILLALLVENPLAGPGTAEGLGYLLVLTYGFAKGRRTYSARGAGSEGSAHLIGPRPVLAQI